MINSVYQQPASCSSVSPPKANNMPNETNFSNFRTQKYLCGADENQGPNLGEKNEKFCGLPIERLLQKVSKEKTGNGNEKNKINLHKPKEIVIENEQKHNSNTEFPYTSKQVTSKKLLIDTKILPQMTPKTLCSSPLSTKQIFQKLTPKLLPPTHDSEVNITFTTLEDFYNVKEDENNMPEGILEPKFNEKNDKYFVFFITKYIKKVNLEETISIEEKLWKILENLRAETEIIGFTKEWWKLTNSNWILTIDVFLLVKK